MTAASGSSERSTAQSGRFSSCEASSTVQEPRHPKREYEEDVSRSSHVQAGPSPRCDFNHAWLVEVESTRIEDEDELPYWYAEGVGAARCIIPRDDAKHVIGKDGRNLQRLQALLGTLIGVVDWSKDTSIVHIYGRREGQNIVRHFLSCLQGSSMGFWVHLSEHWVTQVKG